MLREQYQLLEDNELDVRHEKIDRVKKDAETLAARVEEVDEKIMQKEEQIKKKIEKLTELIVRAERVKTRTARKNPDNADAEISQVQKADHKSKTCPQLCRMVQIWQGMFGDIIRL